MTRDEAITIMQVYKEELEHRIAKIDYDVGAIDLYSIQVEAYDMAIEALQDEAVQGWIPCSERLPDVGEIVIASWSDLWSDAIVFARRYCEDDWEWAYEQGSDYWESARDYDRESNPEAWMPLPEPYEPKTERRG